MDGQLRIERMFAFVVVDPADGTEGIPGYASPSGMLLPMVGADLERIDQLRPVAQRFASEHNLSISVCVFENRVEVERIEP